jgi:glycosyltransferase involved in cell wall biosynthesis
MLLSVAICCHNSSARLPSTLKHLANQTLETDSEWEVILVDNNSNDLTCATAIETWERNGSPTRLRIEKEVNQGLIHARKRAFMSSKSEFIVFCDDDNWLDRNYLAIAIDRMREDSKIGALGGMAIAAFDDGYIIPEWFDAYSQNYAIGSQAEITSNVNQRGFLWGAGLVVRAQPIREMFRLGIAPVLVGRSGTQLMSGDDVELCCWMRAAGYNLYYCESLILYHYLPADRLISRKRDATLEGIKNASKTISVYMDLLFLLNILNSGFRLRNIPPLMTLTTRLCLKFAYLRGKFYKIFKCLIIARQCAA